MNSDQLLEAIGGIDSSFIDNASKAVVKPSKKKYLPVILSACAALLVIGVVVYIAALNLNRKQSVSPDIQSFSSLKPFEETGFLPTEVTQVTIPELSEETGVVDPSGDSLDDVFKPYLPDDEATINAYIEECKALLDYETMNTITNLDNPFVVYRSLPAEDSYMKLCGSDYVINTSEDGFCYAVEFTTTEDPLLGPIVYYVDMSGTVFGCGYRE